MFNTRYGNYGISPAWNSKPLGKLFSSSDISDSHISFQQWGELNGFFICRFFGTISPTFSILAGRTTCSSSNYSGLDLSFVQFLLKNARVLQKMVINMLMADDMVRMDLFQAAQKFLSFPRSYPNAVVTFN
ncbi:hypothetical protein TEA_016432 [Camellia sinensis var. sinensis]|uniref:FBD domain-containing protein n=1 Tax=Camellia sinensis var. sinensis TaxID=542762 RepID=A0A4S4DA50_CAMSN|nr:hypothetical protein TEA_016432 [Camellia sinensis var. sinensis]